ncbi:ATPase [Thermococci archaeon]|nr:MAG: ATPase [Thermococci archaeon]
MSEQDWEDIAKNFDSLQQSLNSVFIEREEPIEGILVALIAKEHVILLGPPGTAKTMMTRAISSAFDLKHFWVLLTRFSTPDEVFGALDIKAFLEDHVFKRKITNMFPEAEVAHVDEIFKANSSMLNSFLTAINERIFFNPEPIEIPLVTLIGTSNEIPREKELAALYDRFLLRYVTPYINDTNNFISMLKHSDLKGIENYLSAFATSNSKLLEECWEILPSVEIPDQIYESLAELRTSLFTNGVIVSDRRMKQALKVLRAKALLKGRGRVIEDDISILRHVLWTFPDERGTVESLVLKISNPLLVQAKEYLDALEEVAGDLFKKYEVVGKDISKQSELILQASEVATKVKETISKIKAIRKTMVDQGKSTKEIDSYLARARSIQQKIVKEIMGMELDEE